MTRALLVIDFINDLVHQDGKLRTCADYVKEYAVIEKVNKVISFFRMQSWPIYFVGLGFQSDYSDLPQDWVFAKENGRLKKGTWSTSMIGNLDFYSDTDNLITKTRVSPFYHTDLEEKLAKADVDEVYLVGVATNNAITLGAREAWDRDIKPTIITDACGASTQEIHQKTLEILPPMIKKTTFNELVENL